jgi:hypothetical protein
VNDPAETVANDNSDLKAAMQARLFQIRDDARATGWTLDKESEVFRISSAWALIASGRSASTNGHAAIRPPSDQGEYEQRAVDCEQALGFAFRDLVDRALVLGWKTPELLEAIERIVQKQQMADAEDPEPAR